MLVESEVRGNSEGVIKINGPFTFTMAMDFKNAYQHLIDNKASSYVIDLENSDYIDSSALGLLLNLKSVTKLPNRAICITNMTPQVREIFNIARFDRLFKLD